MRYIKRQHIPSTWTAEQVNKILSSVDRGHPCGKRDYAILLLIARLGLRDSDVRNLKLDDIKWETNRIELIQTKTTQKVSLPLIQDVGWAIIDYLKHGRPITDSPYVFVKHIIPHDKMSDCFYILKKQLHYAGIRVEADRPHGPHTLRHSLTIF
jgi:integrase